MNTDDGAGHGDVLDNPQVPFSDLELQFKGGLRAPLGDPAELRDIHDDERFHAVELADHPGCEPDLASST